MADPQGTQEVHDADHRSGHLAFVEFLLAKAERDESRREELDGSGFSLDAAMSELVQEETPPYTVDDIRVAFS